MAFAGAFSQVSVSIRWESFARDCPVLILLGIDDASHLGGKALQWLSAFPHCRRFATVCTQYHQRRAVGAISTVVPAIAIMPCQDAAHTPDRDLAFVVHEHGITTLVAGHRPERRVNNNVTPLAFKSAWCLSDIIVKP